MRTAGTAGPSLLLGKVARDLEVLGTTLRAMLAEVPPDDAAYLDSCRGWLRRAGVDPGNVATCLRLLLLLTTDEVSPEREDALPMEGALLCGYCLRTCLSEDVVASASTDGSVAAPRRVAICRSCVGKARTEVLQTEEAAVLEGLTCGFCGVGGPAAGPGTYVGDGMDRLICRGCTALAHDILTGGR